MTDIQNKLKELFPIHKQIGKALIINADNMEVMKHIRDGEFELAIVDPPYGINVNHNMGRRAGMTRSDYKPVKWDATPSTIDYFLQLDRVSANQIIWGANHFMDLIARRSSCWIVWDKMFSADVSFASCELAYTSFDSVTKRFTYSSARADGIHPTQKPVKLYEWLLTNYAKPCQRILDTHLGSGSAAIAANNLGFEFVGIELDADYYEAACKRIEQATAQKRMFA